MCWVLLPLDPSSAARVVDLGPGDCETWVCCPGGGLRVVEGGGGHGRRGEVTPPEGHLRARLPRLALGPRRVGPGGGVATRGLHDGCAGARLR
eukprot:7259592-Pyramimonas_sp.AAC.1